MRQTMLQLLGTAHPPAAIDAIEQRRQVRAEWLSGGVSATANGFLHMRGTAVTNQSEGCAVALRQPGTVRLGADALGTKRLYGFEIVGQHLEAFLARSEERRVGEDRRPTVS